MSDGDEVRRRGAGKKGEVSRGAEGVVPPPDVPASHAGAGLRRPGAHLPGEGPSVPFRFSLEQRFGTYAGIPKP